MWDESKHVLPPEGLPQQYDDIFAAIDYGTSNPFAVSLLGVVGEKIYLIDEYHYDGKKERRQKTDGEYARDMERFLSGYEDIRLVVDPSAASFKVECRKRGMTVKDAENDVLNGIRLVSQLLAAGRLFVSSRCIETIREFTNYIWDPSAQKRGLDVPLKQSDHHLDSLRYGVMDLGLLRGETTTYSWRPDDW
jgi:phage terminase large subunit